MIRRGVSFAFVTAIALLVVVVSASAGGIDDTYMKPANKMSWAEWFKNIYGHNTFRKSFAIVVGVGDYDHHEKLSAPSKDALRVRDFLRDEAGFDYIITLTDDKATRERILRLMEDWFPVNVEQNDRFLFYFSGHGLTRSFLDGTTRGYLVLKSSDVGQWSTMVDMDMRRWGRNLGHARHTLFLIDACFSGFAGFQSAGDNQDQTIERLMQPGHHIVTAGSENEESYSLDGASLFTSAFLSAARGSNSVERIISLSKMMVEINAALDKKRAELADKIKMSPHRWDARTENNAGEFFFIKQYYNVQDTFSNGGESYVIKKSARLPDKPVAISSAEPPKASPPPDATTSPKGATANLTEPIASIKRVEEKLKPEESTNGEQQAIRNTKSAAKPPKPSTQFEDFEQRLIRTFRGHTYGIKSVALSPDGRTALSGGGGGIICGNGELKLWDIASGSEHYNMVDENHCVSSVAISPDGRTALSVSTDDKVKLWDLASGRKLRTFEERGVRSVAFWPDGKRALTGSHDSFGVLPFVGGREDAIKLWDLASGHKLRSFGGEGGVVGSIAFSPDGLTALSGNNVETTSSTGGGMGGGFSTTWRSANIILWDTVSGRKLRSWSNGLGVNSVTLSPDGRTALSDYDDCGLLSCKNTLILRETSSGREIRRFDGHESEIRSITFSPDGRFALSGSDDKTLRLWEVASGRELHSFLGHAEGVSSVAISSDSRFALSGSDDKTLKLWDISDWARVPTVSAGK
jgi:WD40 repeat protein